MSNGSVFDIPPEQRGKTKETVQDVILKEQAKKVGPIKPRWGIWPTPKSVKETEQRGVKEAERQFQPRTGGTSMGIVGDSTMAGGGRAEIGMKPIGAGVGKQFARSLWDEIIDVNKSISEFFKEAKDKL